jgi:glycosyltransferase involved in cell wall biosynthesis
MFTERRGKSTASNMNHMSHMNRMNRPKFSVVIPARNEERFIGRCLESVRVAGAPYPNGLEVIVVLNRCSDKTEEIAHGLGARTIREDARNLARIRNAGARLATGLMLVTIDADSTMSPDTLAAIDRALSSGATVGGGTEIRPDRSSPGIQVTLLLMRFLLLITGLSGGLFWCCREDFEAVGGFNEKLVSGEDLDFARRLMAYGKKTHRPFSTLRGAHIVTSCRKFDKFGDWCVIKNPLMIWRILRGKNQRVADAFYYDFEG